MVRGLHIAPPLYLPISTNTNMICSDRERKERDGWPSLHPPLLSLFLPFSTLTYVYIGVYIYIDIYVYIHICVYICIYVYIYTRIFVCASRALDSHILFHGPGICSIGQFVSTSNHQNCIWNFCIVHGAHDPMFSLLLSKGSQNDKHK